MHGPARRIGRQYRGEIAAAVRVAEEATAAEIVPVIASSSDRYERAEDLCGLSLGLLSLVTVRILLATVSGEMPALLLAVEVLALLSGFIVGVVLAGQVAMVRRIFVAPRRRTAAVAARAQQVFVQRRVHQTAGGTGIVVYLSLFEGRAAILADQAVHDHLTDGRLDRLAAELSAGVRAGQAGPALVAAIEQLGRELGDVLPRYDDDVNELPDALVLLD